jgi:hypothetical protein
MCEWVPIALRLLHALLLLLLLLLLPPRGPLRLLGCCWLPPCWLLLWPWGSCCRGGPRLRYDCIWAVDRPELCF